MKRKNSAIQKDTEEKVSFLLRLPTGLREKIGQEAERERRSMTAQIICILEERYKSTPESLLKKAG